MNYVDLFLVLLFLLYYNEYMNEDHLQQLDARKTSVRILTLKKYRCLPEQAQHIELPLYLIISTPKSNLRIIRSRDRCNIFFIVCFLIEEAS